MPLAARSPLGTLLTASLSCLLIWGCSSAPSPSESFPEQAQTSARPSAIASPAPSPTPSAQPSARTRIDTHIEIIQPTSSPSGQEGSTVNSPKPAGSPSPSATPTPTPSPSASSSRSSGSGSSSGVGSSPVRVSSVSILQTATTQIDVGKSLNLYAAVKMSNGKTNQNFTWSSSAPGIANVDETGLVTGGLVGTADIIATSVADPSKTARLTLTITSPVYRFPGKIVYKRDNDLYLMDGTNANPERLTFTDDEEEVWPRFNWTGSKITFRLGGVEDIGVIDLEGDRQIQRLDVSAENLAPLPLYWYSDNLLYQDRDVNGAEFHGIYMRRPDGSTRLLTHDLSRVGPIAGVTPNGLIYYQRLNHILSYQTNVPNSMHSYDVGDSPKMATNSSPSLVVYSNADNYISKLDLAGNITVLTGPGTQDMFAALSPDEQHIVFCSKRFHGQWDLFMMNADGTNVINLTHTLFIDEVLPDWGN